MVFGKRTDARNCIVSVTIMPEQMNFTFNVTYGPDKLYT